jgi:hypothetical protein
MVEESILLFVRGLQRSTVLVDHLHQEHYELSSDTAQVGATSGSSPLAVLHDSGDRESDGVLAPMGRDCVRSLRGSSSDA